MDTKKSFVLLMALKNLKDLMDLLDEEEETCVERQYWVKPFLEKRQLHSLEAHILKDILWDTNDYRNFCRLRVDDFENLLLMVQHNIKKENTIMRDAIPPRTRLAITLRYIATGDSYRSLEFLTRVSRKTISKFIPEVLNAIVVNLSDRFLKMPASQTEWRNISNDFNKMWQFPHTLGAIDGKHIRIKRPPHAGSDFFNYKGYHSVVLLAVVDAHSRFIYVDVGGNGRASDTVLFKNSSLYTNLKCGNLNIPQDENLPGQHMKTSYYFIGDDIFGIDRNLLKAYNRNAKLATAQEVFNYRLSRARMSVEMAFGRLASRFRIFHRPIEVELKTCDLVITACCILHNMLTKNVSDCQKPIQTQNVEKLPSTMTPLPTQQNEILRFANEMRENVKKYLICEGDVQFQWLKIKKQVANPVTVVIE